MGARWQGSRFGSSESHPPPPPRDRSVSRGTQSPRLSRPDQNKTPESDNTTVLPISSLWAPEELTPRIGFSSFTAAEAGKVSRGVGKPSDSRVPRLWLARGAEGQSRPPLTPGLRAKPRPQQPLGVRPGVGPFPPPGSPGLRRVPRPPDSRGPRPESRGLCFRLLRAARLWEGRQGPRAGPELWALALVALGGRAGPGGRLRGSPCRWR